jgi:multidrug efflux system outer membrane protein
LQVESAKQIVAIRAEETRIITERIKAGVGTPSEKAQAEVVQATAVSALSDLRRARANAEHLLGALVSQPDLVVAVKSKAMPMKAIAPAVGLPSDLLQYRPDVLAAEQALISANALIGYNKAFFFPSFTLTGLGGVESRQLNTLFSPGNDTSVAGLGVTVPLLDWGRTQAHVDAAVGVRNEAAANYNRTILTAFREVRDALSGLNELGISTTAAKQRLASAQEALRIEKARLSRGEVNPLSELVARRTVAESQIALTQILLQQLGAEVDLVQALGGARPDVAPATANTKTL